MIRELGPEETALVHEAMQALRPHVGDAAAFSEHVNRLERPEGYRLVASFADGDAQAAAVAGFRITHHLAWGLALYCDDLSTRPEHRNQGHAGRLLDWLVAEARQAGCDELHLDSGVGPDRTAAHRLYFNKGMRISAHHFVMKLAGG